MTRAEQAQARLDALAARLEPKLREAFRAYVRSLAPERLPALADLLASGDVDAVVEFLTDRQAYRAASEDLRTVYATALQDASVRETLALSARLRVRVVAPLMPPPLLAALRTWENTAFQNIVSETRDGLRVLVADRLASGVGPRQAAVALKADLATGGLTAYDEKIIASFRQALADGRYKDALGPKNAAGKFDAGRTLRDRRYDRTLEKLLGKQGGTLSPKQIESMTAAYRRKLVAFRAETFARTQAMQAANDATMGSWQNAIAQGVVPATELRRYWVVAKDERLCERCAPIPRLNQDGVAFEQPFVIDENGTTAQRPPLHPNCRCGLSIVRTEQGVRPAPAPGSTRFVFP